MPIEADNIYCERLLISGEAPLGINSKEAVVLHSDPLRHLFSTKPLFFLRNGDSTMLMARDFDTISQELSKLLSVNTDSWNSIELQVTIKIEQHTSDGKATSKYDTILQHYVETKLGERYFLSRNLLKTNEVGRYSLHSNGKQNLELQFDTEDLGRQNAVIVRKSFGGESRSDHMEIPIPYLFFFVGRVPLAKSLNNAKSLGTDMIEGLACEVYYFKGIRWPLVQDQVYYLDKASGVPLKVEAYRDQNDWEAKKPIWTWKVDSLNEYEGHRFPGASKMTSFDPLNNAPIITWGYNLDEIKFDRDHPEHLFSPDLQPGVPIFNELTKKSSVAPGQPAIKSVKGHQSSVKEPIQASPPAEWTMWFSYSTLTLSLVLLVVGGFMWIRRNR